MPRIGGALLREHAMHFANLVDQRQHKNAQHTDRDRNANDIDTSEQRVVPVYIAGLRGLWHVGHDVPPRMFPQARVPAPASDRVERLWQFATAPHCMPAAQLVYRLVAAPKLQLAYLAAKGALLRR